MVRSSRRPVCAGIAPGYGPVLCAARKSIRPWVSRRSARRSLHEGHRYFFSCARACAFPGPAKLRCERAGAARNPGGAGIHTRPMPRSATGPACRSAGCRLETRHRIGEARARVHVAFRFAARDGSARPPRDGPASRTPPIPPPLALVVELAHRRRSSGGWDPPFASAELPIASARNMFTPPVRRGRRRALEHGRGPAPVSCRLRRRDGSAPVYFGVGRGCVGAAFSQVSGARGGRRAPDRALISAADGAGRPPTAQEEDSALRWYRSHPLRVRRARRSPSTAVSSRARLGRRVCDPRRADQ